MPDAATPVDSLPVPVAMATALGHLSDGLREAAGDNLVALVLYGGLARGRHRGTHSDVDLAVVLRDAAPERVLEVAPVLLAAGRAARVEPWILGAGELPRVAAVFPTRVLDIQEHHVVLHGEDVFAGIAIDRGLLRLRVEQELTNLALRLRRQLVALAGDPASMSAYLAGVARPLAIQLAALLRLAGRRLPDEDRSAAIFEAAALAFDLDGEALASLAALRQGEPGVGDAAGMAELFGRIQAAASRAAAGAATLEPAP